MEKRDTSKEISNLFGKIILIIAGIIAASVSILDLFGLLTSYQWLTDRISLIILLLLGLLVTFEAFQQRDYSSEIKREINECTNQVINNIRNLHGIDVLQFENVAELYNHVETKLSTASKSVEDITWGSRKSYRTKVEQEAYVNYVAAIEKVCSKGNINYREVSSLSDENYFRRSMNLIDKQYYSYHLGYYDISEITVPLISFIIIDAKEVILGFYRVPSLDSEGEIYLSITQPDTVKLFKDYFEVIWVRSDKVKDADLVNHDLINQIKHKLNIEE